MKKHFTIKKRKNQRNKRKNQRSTLRKRFSKTMRKHKRNNKTVYIRNKTKRLRKKHIFSRIYKGGDAQYPAVYGIDNKSVLYPISKYGITAGLPDPPIPSNGPFGNGPIGRDINSGKGMSSDNMLGEGTYFGTGGGSQGTIAPQSLVNLTRSLTGGVTEVLNGFGGYTNSDSLNPMPYNQPIGQQDTKYLRTNFPNVEESYNKADKYVSTF